MLPKWYAPKSVAELLVPTHPFVPRERPGSIVKTRLRVRLPEGRRGARGRQITTKAWTGISSYQGISCPVQCVSPTASFSE